ncbi:MAG: TrkH family potassium uptake protein [Ruminococcaceae bacterium]|nr:TrkH family potassium uptake protein [Oscillospiraceae bacterium]
MNRKIVFGITGRLLQAMAVILLLPLLVSAIYKESNCIAAFIISACLSFSIGTVLRFATKNYSKELYAKEGFLIVSLAWVSASLIGCLPFIISGEIPSFFDALFETVSGFTTTGASVVTNVEELSHGIIFWRSFTHWIGGMGVLVFMLAFVNNISDKAIHIMRAEMPGPVVGKLVPRAKDTSKVLYIMYIVMTLVQIVLLWCGEMNLFEAVVHTFGTAGTGGFGLKADSIASYSAYSQWIITVFMLIFGINFNLYFLLIIKRFRSTLKSTELWTYLGIVITSIVIVSVNISPAFTSLSDTIRTAAFQVSSIMTTTGYSTTDFNLWPNLSKTILLILMFIGACAGSTAGGLKVSRVILLFKMGFREIKRMIHPRSVVSIKFEGKEVDDHTKHSVTTYFAVYMVCFFFIFLLLSFEEAPFDFETNFSAVAACFNNIGPGFGVVGPMGSFAQYSDFSKIVLSFAMLFGRLEIFPLLIALIPSTWRKR